MKELQKVSEAAVLCKGNKGMGVLSRNLPTEFNSVGKSELKPQQKAAANDLFIGGNMKQIESGKVMTIKQIVNEIKEAGLVAPSERTIQRDVRKCFPDKKIENGKAITLTELEFTLLLDYMKHKNNRSDLASTTVVEHLTTNLSPALKMKQAFDLMNEAYQEEITRLKQQNIEVVEENGVLKLENKQLVEENNYLKKLNDFNTTKLGYYTKKYHSWYDDYENY